MPWEIQQEVCRCVVVVVVVAIVLTNGVNAPLLMACLSGTVPMPMEAFSRARSSISLALSLCRMLNFDRLVSQIRWE